MVLTETVGYTFTMKRLKTALRHVVARQLEARVQKLISERKLKVVAVTGSYGKTSTKLAIASVLKQRYRVMAHEGNYNSELGLPLSIFELDVPKTLTNPLSWFKLLEQVDKKMADDYPYDVLVLELGVDQPGDMGRFMRYLSPDIGVVTAIGPVHIEQLGSIENITREKMALAVGSRIVILNAEEELVMAQAQGLHKPVQTYGFNNGQIHWSKVSRGTDQMLCGEIGMSEGIAKVQTQFLGEHSLVALAAAAAVGEELALTPDQVKTGLELVTSFSGRMQVLKGAEGSLIIDDTYNAPPSTVVSAIKTLLELPGRHIAILGSINYLGSDASRIHREIGAAAKNVDLLVTVGYNANKFIVAGAAQAGLAAEQIHIFNSPYAAGAFVRKILQSKDVVLAKGSQDGIFVEEAIAQLLGNPDDRSKLVRQSSAWQQLKREQFDDAPL